MLNTTKFDLTGIGIGPFNLGLAALSSSHPSLRTVFLERKPEFRWHGGLILPGTTLQVPFLADLVTMIDPSHRLSFLNYLHEHDRLYKFYFYERFLILRKEYDDYCRWASQKLSSCKFNEDVTDVVYHPESGDFITESVSPDGKHHSFRSRHIAIGIGTSPALPKWANEPRRTLVLHSADFAYYRDQLEKCKRVTVIGSGQSAAECVLALYSSLTQEKIVEGASIQWITRSAGFFPMEYSKLGQECFTPEYMRHFHDIALKKRREIVASQGLIYKGMSLTTIADLFDMLYERSVGGANPGLELFSNVNIDSVEDISASNSARISLRHRHLDKTYAIDTDAIVAATGYHHVWPDWFERLKASILVTDEFGDCIVDQDFTARRRDNGAGNVFIQNAEPFQHGVGAPDLGLGAYRNAIILNQLLSHNYYRLQENTSCQHYGLPEKLSAEPANSRELASSYAVNTI